MIKVDGLVLVSRDAATARSTSTTTPTTPARAPRWGAVGGAVVGLIFPPACSPARRRRGRRRRASAGSSHGEKKAIKADVEDTLPPDSSGIVAMFEEQWAADDRQGPAQASKVTKEQVDPDSAHQVKAAVEATPPA